VGADVVRALLQSRRQVRCLVRREIEGTASGLNVEMVVGDVTDIASLNAAMAGVVTLYHCAADYRLWVKDPAELDKVNVGGTEKVMAAAAQAHVARVVYTSSVGALGLTKDGSPADETTPIERAAVVGRYKKSKYDAERVAQVWAERGLPVVIVNPSTPVGELDIKPTPTGQVIVDFLRGRIPAYVDTGLNLVDVRDVARGHLLAAERGRIGEKYILGNRNMTLKEILDALSRLTGRSAPRLRLPHAVPLAVAAVSTLLAEATGRPPRVSLESVRMSMHRMFFDAGKAVRELAFPQSPVEEALGRAIAWFREKGYVAAG
jgi:dihydroflavonol-4-reductase